MVMHHCHLLSPASNRVLSLLSQNLLVSRHFLACTCSCWYTCQIYGSRFNALHSILLHVHTAALTCACLCPVPPQTTENTTAIEGISSDDTSTTLVNALLGALGAKAKIPKERSSPIADLTDGNNKPGSSRITRRSTKKSRQRRRRSSSRASVNASVLQGASFQDLRSSQKLTDGILTASDGSEFCVAGKDMIVEPGSNVLQSGKMTFASSERFDPACADEAVDKAKHCQGGTSRAPSMFMDIGTTPAATTAAAGDIIAPGQGLMDAGQVINASALACTQGFQKVGGLLAVVWLWQLNCSHAAVTAFKKECSISMLLRHMHVCMRYSLKGCT